MIGSGLRNRLRVLLIGLVTIILVFACLLGCIEFVSQNAKQDTSSNNLFNRWSNNNSTISPVSISSTISPESAKSGHTPLFKINNSEYISLLRSTVTTTYDGKNWLKDTDQEYTDYKQGNLLEKGDRSAIQIVYTNSTEVTPINMSSKGRSPLPTSLYVQDIYLPNNPDETLLYSSTEQLFYSGNGFQSYTFDTVRYYFDKPVLTSAQIETDTRYLQLPKISARIRELALNIIADKTHPYDKAKAIESYLKTNYIYSLNYKHAPKGWEFNDWFLFEEKKGGCANFNSAFVILARVAGLPARLVSGYSITPIEGSQIVYSDQAHAWSEIEFKNLGWITFDATGTATNYSLDTNTDEDSNSGFIPTKIEITIKDSFTQIEKGNSMNVEGVVLTDSGTPVNGVPVEIFLSSSTENSRILIGKCQTTSEDQINGKVDGNRIVWESLQLGSFSFTATIPDIPVGSYYLIAHCVGNRTYQESWSDPEKAISATKLMLDLPATIFQNKPFEIRGQLMLITDESIPQQPVEIYINGMLIATVVTDKDGRFKLQQTWKAGTYTIRVLFHGTEHYAQSEIYLH